MNVVRVTLSALMEVELLISLVTYARNWFLMILELSVLVSCFIETFKNLVLPKYYCIC